MNILEQVLVILEDRGNGPTVSIMLTQNQATELYNTLYKIKSQKIGQWVNNQNGTYTCDNCGCKHSRSRYCPDCGRQMEVKE